MSDINKLLSIMQEQGERNNTPYPSIGKVKSVDPFLVQVNDLTLYKDDLYIPTDLLQNNISGEITLNGTLTGTTSTNNIISGTSYNTHNHSLQSATFKGSFTTNNSTQFEIGDLVILLPLSNKQKYVLLNKVVALE